MLAGARTKLMEERAAMAMRVVVEGVVPMVVAMAIRRPGQTNEEDKAWQEVERTSSSRN